MFFVYILKSIRDNKYYTGSTNNIERRLEEHNLGKVKSTKFRIPLELIYLEKFNSYKEARNREFFFKTPKGSKERNKLLLISGVEQSGSSSGS